MMNKKTMILLITGILYLLFFMPIFDWGIKLQAIAALVIIQILWISRVFALAYSSLLFFLLLSFHFFTYQETLAYFSSEVVWLLFSTFIISQAFIESGLASRVSFQLLKMSRGSGRALIFISFLLLLILSILIPSNVGKANLVSSVFDRLLKYINGINNVNNIGAALFIGISYMAAISGAFVATGASSTIYTFGLFSNIVAGIDYVTWLIYFVPPIVVYILLLWLVFIYVLPPEAIDRKRMLKLLDEHLIELGKLSISEKKMMIIMSMVLILWATQTIHGFSIPLIGLLGASLTVLPGIGIWEWKLARKSIDWDMMLFFSSTLMVSGMLIQTGTIAWIADLVIRTISTRSEFVMIVILVLCTAILRMIFVNILGYLTIMLPLAISIGEGLQNFSPLIVAMAVFLAGIPGFFLITQSPVHLISFSYGYFTERQLLKIGVPSSLLWLMLIIGAVLFYWRFVL
ncbi:SLC13 family permease [Thalassobacillus pellis]|uniref:SLC13 family permease n=1 Tax=Thalassobacillus pellis TaxID=748008 RepID=UPI001EF8077B|nr:SLC13 family permease [Thalassobacillus pellis]MBM7552655.1 anion transporter [Thalassobacillus pellis]